MIRKVIPSLVFAAAALLSSAASIYSQNTNPVKIVRGNQDTVYQASHLIIGVTEPGKSILINGAQVPVYKTGSFGWETPLLPGENKITIQSLPDNTSTTLRVFYSTTKREDQGERIKKEAEARAAILRDTNFMVKTLEGAYLNYGNGTDRLGGAKINFLDKDIPLHVVAQNKNLYKVRLSENRYAFLPKTVVSKIAEKNAGDAAPILSGSWSVAQMPGFDRVSILLDEKRPYIVKQEINPGKIILDLYGVQCNSNWITQYLPLESIESVDVKGEDSDIMRVTIHLSNKSFWGYSVKYKENRLFIDVKHAPKQFTIKGLTIGVDAGHGGENGNGAVSAAGYKEKDQNLAMALMLKELLEKQGAKVIMSRDGDYAKDNTQRVQEFKDQNIDLLISVHCNAGGNPLKTGGASTYYRHIEYRELAKHILARVLEIKGVQNFGLVGNFNFTLNSPTEFPSVLVETLFMSNLWDEEHITDANFQKTMMEKVVEGLHDYLQYCKEQEKNN